MTRENKLALVVGFGLILFVGILISDHFSTVRTQQAADLTRVAIVDPLSPKIEPTSLIDLMPRPQTPAHTPAVSPATLDTAARTAGISDPVRPEHRTIIHTEGYTQRVVQQPGSSIAPGQPQTPPSDAEVPQGFVAVAPEPAAQQVKVAFHDVRSGETLFAICRQYYDNASLSAALAKYNNIDDPASLRAGRRLMIPPAEELGGRSPQSSALASANKPTGPATAPQQNASPANLPIKVVRTASATSTPAAKPKPAASAARTYTVKPGDSLAQIAQRLYGSKSKWKKLHEMNRDVIDNPDALRVGTVLRVL